MVKLVGILNVTPDSFSDGGQFFEPSAAVAHANKLFAEGASIVDIGAESTRPGATPLSAEEEWQRLEHILHILVPAYPGNISLDSYHPETVERACAIGPIIVNDVSGMNNPEMIRIVSKCNMPVVISHSPSSDIQAAHRNEPIDNILTVKEVLLEKAHHLMASGIDKKSIILDPGIGFGKTMSLNHELLKFAELVADFDVMIGHSRKRFLGENRIDLQVNVDAGVIAVEHGAAYLRVHDVAGHARTLHKKKM